MYVRVNAGYDSCGRKAVRASLPAAHTDGEQPESCLPIALGAKPELCLCVCVCVCVCVHVLKHNKDRCCEAGEREAEEG